MQALLEALEELFALLREWLGIKRIEKVEEREDAKQEADAIKARRDAGWTNRDGGVFNG